MARLPALYSGMSGYESATRQQDVSMPWVSFCLYVVGWFACILSAAWGLPWLGALNALFVMAVHVVSARPRESELFLLLVACGMGALSESWLLQSGLVHYPNQVSVSMLAPYWIIMLWGLFGTMLNTALRWLRDEWFVQMLAGLVGGPLVYLGGSELGAFELANPLRAMLAVGLMWGVALPVLMALSIRLDGYDSSNRFYIR